METAPAQRVVTGPRNGESRPGMTGSAVAAPMLGRPRAFRLCSTLKSTGAGTRPGQCRRWQCFPSPPWETASSTQPRACSRRPTAPRHHRPPPNRLHPGFAPATRPGRNTATQVGPSECAAVRCQALRMTNRSRLVCRLSNNGHPSYPFQCCCGRLFTGGAGFELCPALPYPTETLVPVCTLTL